jgi:hypothetical protein
MLFSGITVPNGLVLPPALGNENLPVLT